MTSHSTGHWLIKYYYFYMSDNAISRPRKPTLQILLIISKNLIQVLSQQTIITTFLLLLYSRLILMWWYFLIDDESDMLYNWRHTFFNNHSCISDNI